LIEGAQFFQQNKSWITVKYFDWNIAIGNYFFNYEKAGKEVHLFISPFEIGKIGINQLGACRTLKYTGYILS
jgi:hypothetical protein